MISSSENPQACDVPKHAFVFEQKEFIARLLFLFIALMICKEFIFTRMLHFQIPAFNTLCLIGFTAIVFALQRPKLLWDRTHMILFGAVLAFTAINTYAVDAEWWRWRSGLFRTLQPALVCAIFLLIDLPKEKIIKVMKWLNIMILFGTLIAICEAVLARHTTPSLFLLATWSFYAFPTYQSAWLSANVANSLYLYRATKKKRYLASALFCIVAIITVGRRKSFVSALMIFSLFLLLDGPWRQKVRKLFVGTLIAIVVLTTIGKPFMRRFMAVSAYTNATSADTQARTALSVKCFTVAKDYFPWGSGIGTFASKPAYDSYSPLYYKYNLSGIRGLEPYAGKGDFPSFLLDTYWPHIIGEFGSFGTLLFLALWTYPLLSAMRLPKSPQRKELLFFTVATWITILLESTGSTYPEQLQFILVYCGLTALLLRQARKELSHG